MRAALIVPAPLATISGGYGYDRRIIAGLREAGHAIEAVELAGAHPLPDEAALVAAHAAWDALAEGTIPVIDGLALPAFAGRAGDFAARGAVGLIHHPTCMEAGISEPVAALLRQAESELFPRLPRIVVTSETTRDTLVNDFAVEPARISVVVPGTDPAPRVSGSGGPGCRILCLASFTPRKGHEVLLRALAKLFDLDWHLTIAGAERESMYGRSVAALAEELGIARRVVLADVLEGDALDALWRGTDIFALATRYEGYGMAIAEALARGIPVAITDGGAAGKLVPVEAGVVCPVDDVVTYSKSLRRMIFDTELRAAMAEAAWQAGQALPDWRRQGDAFAAALA